VDRLSKSLLALAAITLAAGAVMHFSAFSRIDAAVASSDLAAFAGNGLRTLWIADSATSLLVAITLGLFVVRPANGSRAIVALLAFIPGVTAILIYYFIGNFIGGHIEMAAALFAVAGAFTKSR
jgi:hypothetical protein